MRRLCLAVEDFRLYLDGALDRVRDKAIFFGLIQNSWQPAQVIDRSNHYFRFNHDLGYLVIAARRFLELALGCRGETNQRHLGIFRDREEGKHIAGA